MTVCLAQFVIGTVIIGTTGTFIWLYKSSYLHTNSSKKRVIIFSRYPRPGSAKTRLVGELGTHGAAAAQRFMTEHLLNQVQSFLSVNDAVQVELQYSDGSADEVKYWLGRRQSRIPQFWCSPQKGGHLGARMSAAFSKAFSEGNNSTVLVGSDIPGIDSAILAEAFRLLEEGSKVMTLGAATDGGYFLVGLNRDSQKDLGSLFEGVQWGTAEVYQQQIQVARAHNLRVHTLSKKLQDIDTPEDLPEFEDKVGISLKELKAPVLSVIVPTYNEEDSIRSTLDCLVSNVRFPRYAEIIVSDGGSTDQTRKLVKEFAESCTACKVVLVDSPKGRGNQLNNGVKHSSGFNLLFVHADTALPRAYDSHVMVTLAEPGVVCGAFEFALDVLETEATDINHSKDSNQDPVSTIFKYKLMALVWFTNRRARKHELPYGDQALFMSRRTLDAVGGFPEYRLMEDYTMVKNLQRLGHIKIVDDAKAITSARRWRKHGLVKVTGFNRIVVILYNLGVHPDTLAGWYYGWFR